jgi:hypothetical protein
MGVYKPTHDLKDIKALTNNYIYIIICSCFPYGLFPSAEDTAMVTWFLVNCWVYYVSNWGYTTIVNGVHKPSCNCYGEVVI